MVCPRDEKDCHTRGFVVEKQDGPHPDGYGTELITGTMGQRAVWHPDFQLRDVRLPATNMLEGASFTKDVNTVLPGTRGGAAAWERLGHAGAAYEVAVRYAGERQQLGTPIEYHCARHLTDMEVVHTDEAPARSSGSSSVGRSPASPSSPEPVPPWRRDATAACADTERAIG